MNHHQLAQKFVNGATKGGSSNMFIEGDTIYSYGHHFKIATRYQGYFLVNSNSYSVSTSRQQSYVNNTLPREKMVYAPDCQLNGEYLIKKIDELKLKQKRARKSDYTRLIETYKRMLNIYLELIAR